MRVPNRPEGPGGMVAHARGLQLLHQPVARAPHLGHVGVHVVLVPQGGEGGGDGEAVDVVRAGDAADAIDHGGMADREADAHVEENRASVFTKDDRAIVCATAV